MKLENWSPGYAIVKLIVSLPHRLMYRKYEIIGKENLKSDKPIIFAPNHQNALNDALIVLYATPFQLVWLARADIFASKVASRVLRFMKMSPVYRIRDGKDSLGKNEEVFNAAIRVLKNNNQLALFPEATHSGKRQSIVHKKAVPRIAFIAAEETNFELDIKIVPTGIYYSNYYEFDKDALVYFGKPLNLRDYKDLYVKNPSECTNRLRKDLNKAVLEISFNIPSKDHYEAYEFLRDVIGRFEGKQKPETNATLWSSIQRDQAIVDHIYKNEQEQTAEFDSLIKTQQAYKNALLKAKATDTIVVADSPTYFEVLIKGVMLLGLAPVALLGYFLHYFLYAFPLPKIKKKIKDEAFWGSFLFVLSVGGGIVLYALYAVLLTLAFHTWFVTLGVLTLLPLTAKVAWRWQKTLNSLKGRMKLRKEEWVELKKLRHDIIKAYQKLK